MIETHVFNALLLPQLKEDAFFKVLTFVNGLVAPSFLFCAGLALAITLSRKWNDYCAFKKPLWKYFIRLLFILIVGYSLHLPFFSLSRLRSVEDMTVWRPFFQADILQTISVSLMVGTILVLILRKESIYVWVLSIISLGVIFSSPVVRQLDYSSAPAWLSPYFTMQVKSQFPLFPWAAFLLMGILVGLWFLSMKKRQKEKIFINRCMLASFLLIVVSIAAELIPFTLYPNHDFWNASPEFFFVRFGIIVLLLSVLWFYEHKKTVSPNSVFTLFGKESLLVYTVHLLIVYGYTYKWSFIRYFGPTMNYLQCFGLFVLLTAAMWMMAFAWYHTKKWNIHAAKAIQFVILAGIVLSFLLRTE